MRKKGKRQDNAETQRTRRYAEGKKEEFTTEVHRGNEEGQEE